MRTRCCLLAGLWLAVACFAALGCNPSEAPEFTNTEPSPQTSAAPGSAAAPSTTAPPAASAPAVEPTTPQTGSPVKDSFRDWKPSARELQQRLQPNNFAYVGAFRLPANVAGSSWEYSGGGMTYYPAGDPESDDDGFPGSLFAIGHDHHQKVSEFSIPRPVNSPTHRLEPLPIARTIQPFHDIRGGLVGELEIPRAGLEFLPQPGKPGKLHFCWGQHFQFELQASHGWAELKLSAPQTKGLWRLGSLTNYVTNDYLFAIPDDWAKAHLPENYRLASGRFRDGLWGGRGPALVAYAPPPDDAPPPHNATIEQVRTLLMYGRPQPGSAELEVNPQWSMRDFRESDEWSGGAWLTHGERHAVMLCGTKGQGKAWYGFSNGVEYPTSGDPNDPIPPVPDFPHDQRGWWSESISGQLLFIDPAELAAVVRGDIPSWAPQPYASMSIDEHLFDAGYDFPRQKMSLLGACAFDRDRGRLFVVERQVEVDEDRSLIHVFQLK